MTEPLVRCERHGHVAVVRLDNPPLNIITKPVRDQLVPTLQDLDRDEDVRAVVLTGTGDRSFCAGADLNEEGELTPETVRSFIAEDDAVHETTRRLRPPVVAAINGHCMGGGLELALSCDIRIVADDAKLCAAGVKVGLVVSTTRLTYLLGPARASDLILTGRTLLGDEAERIGLASRAVPRARVLEDALEWAGVIAGRAPLAVQRAKRAIANAVQQPYETALASEFDDFAALSATRDHKHAIEAFFNREQPRFEGR